MSVPASETWRNSLTLPQVLRTDLNSLMASLVILKLHCCCKFGIASVSSTESQESTNLGRPAERVQTDQERTRGYVGGGKRQPIVYIYSEAALAGVRRRGGQLSSTPSSSSYSMQHCCAQARTPQAFPACRREMSAPFSKNAFLSSCNELPPMRG
jgi:hypothetical protein